MHVCMHVTGRAEGGGEGRRARGGREREREKGMERERKEERKRETTAQLEYRASITPKARIGGFSEV